MPILLGYGPHSIRYMIAVKEETVVPDPVTMLHLTVQPVLVPVSRITMVPPVLKDTNLLDTMHIVGAAEAEAEAQWPFQVRMLRLRREAAVR